MLLSIFGLLLLFWLNILLFVLLLKKLLTVEFWFELKFKNGELLLFCPNTPKELILLLLLFKLFTLKEFPNFIGSKLFTKLLLLPIFWCIPNKLFLLLSVFKFVFKELLVLVLNIEFVNEIPPNKLLWAPAIGGTLSKIEFFFVFRLFELSVLLLSFKFNEKIEKGCFLLLKRLLELLKRLLFPADTLYKKVIK